MDVKCPKCGALVECDESMLYDEFVYNEETCDTCHDKLNRILFIKRKFPPDQGKLALPGGFVGPFETCEQAAVREIFEECGLKIYESNLEEIGVFSAPGCQFANVFDTKFKTSDLAFDHIDMLWRYYKSSPW